MAVLTSSCSLVLVGGYTSRRLLLLPFPDQPGDPPPASRFVPLPAPQSDLPSAPRSDPLLAPHFGLSGGRNTYPPAECVPSPAPVLALAGSTGCLLFTRDTDHLLLLWGLVCCLGWICRLHHHHFAFYGISLIDFASENASVSESSLDSSRNCNFLYLLSPEPLELVTA